MKLSKELLSLYNMGCDNKIIKSIFIKLAIFLSLFLLLSFHFLVPSTNRFASLILLKNISYMFEPRLSWKNSIEFPNLILYYDKFHDNILQPVKIIEWNKNGGVIIKSKKGYFTRNVKILTLKLVNANVKVIRDNKIIANIQKKRYLYRLDFANMVSRFLKNVKENNTLALIQKIKKYYLSNDITNINKTIYEINKRNALSITPLNFFFLGLTLAFIIPTTSLILSQVIALLIVFMSFYSVMVFSSKFIIQSILINSLLPFIPNITLFTLSILLFILSNFIINNASQTHR